MKKDGEIVGTDEDDQGGLPIVVSDFISCAGQPSEAQLRKLAGNHFHVVINLGLENAPYALSNEGSIVMELGMRYVNLPVDFGAPLREDFERFVECMTAHSEQRVWVHCAANKRASCFVALWMERQGWSKTQSDELIRQVWQPDGVWRRFLEAVRAQCLL